MKRSPIPWYRSPLMGLANLSFHVALLIWRAEALTLLISILFKGRETRLDDLPVTLVSWWESVFLEGQVVAGVLLLVGVLLRRAFHADPLPSPPLAWLGTLLVGMLCISSAYLFSVAIPEMKLYQIAEPAMSRVQVLEISKDQEEGGVEMDTYTRQRERFTDIAFRRASASMGIVLVCQMIASAGLLVLHLRGYLERKHLGVRRRGRRVPPWRVTAP